MCVCVCVCMCGLVKQQEKLNVQSYSQLPFSNIEGSDERKSRIYKYIYIYIYIYNKFLVE